MHLPNLDIDDPDDRQFSSPRGTPLSGIREPVCPAYSSKLADEEGPTPTRKAGAPTGGRSLELEQIDGSVSSPLPSPLTATSCRSMATVPVCHPTRFRGAGAWVGGAPTTHARDGPPAHFPQGRRKLLSDSKSGFHVTNDRLLNTQCVHFVTIDRLLHLQEKY